MRTERFGMTAAPKRSLALQAVLVALCILAAVKFVIRLAPASHLTTGNTQNDLKITYISSRAWMRGLDPYDQAILTHVWTVSGGTADTMPLRTKAPSIYPPTTLVLLSAIMIPSWPMARAIWRALSVAALVLLLVYLHRFSRCRLFTPRSLCLIGGTLALEPVTTTLWLGQSSIIVAAAVAASLVYGFEDRRLASGTLEGLAFSIKPQLAIVFAAPFVVARRWKACIAAAVTIATLVAIAFIHVGSPIECIVNWYANLRFTFAANGENDPSRLVNAARLLGKDWASAPMDLTDLINLQYPLSVMVESKVAVSLLAWSLGLVLALPALLVLIGRPNRWKLIHAVALMAIVELLVSYHRGYDAVLVVFPLAWALSPETRLSRAWPILLGIAVFWVPLGGFLFVLDRSHLIPMWLTSRAVWRTVVLPLQSWTLFVMAAWLSYLLWQSEVFNSGSAPNCHRYEPVLTQ